MRDAELFRFIDERYRIFKRKEAGVPKPGTSDPILQKYKFTNVHRENDRVTRWIAKNGRRPNKDNPDLRFAMCVARYVNLPDSLEEIGFPVPWKPEHFKDVMFARKRNGKTLFTGAYIIHSLGPKVPYLADKVFTPLWKDRALLRPKNNDTLESFFNRLHEYKGMGSFMAAQVVADMKYVEPLYNADDWYTWAAMGPGSARGLNRVLGRDKNAKWKKGEWLQKLNLLQIKVDKFTKENDIPRVHAQDCQNILCEADKFERVRLGEGRPRSLYPGGVDD